MENKKQDEKSLEELVKIADSYRAFFDILANEFSKIIVDIKEPEQEEDTEDTWEMKCPYNYNDSYYYIAVSGNVSQDCWCDFEGEKESFEAGNIFKTKEAAQLEAKRRNLLTRFRAFRDECNNGWKPDFNDDEEKYYLYYSILEECIDVGWIVLGCSFNIFGYFKNQEDAERAIELFGDEIKELFVDCEVQ